MNDLERINAKLDEILRRLEAVTGKPKPHMTRAEFAKAVGVHPNTVTRWIDRGRVRTEKGRIPRSQLAAFVS